MERKMHMRKEKKEEMSSTTSVHYPDYMSTTGTGMKDNLDRDQGDKIQERQEDIQSGQTEMKSWRQRDKIQIQISPYQIIGQECRTTRRGNIKTKSRTDRTTVNQDIQKGNHRDRKTRPRTRT